MKTLYFDVLCGASGDMILSALIDIGVPVEYLREQLAKLAIPGLSISVEKLSRSGIACSHLILSWATPESGGSGHGSFRNAGQIMSIISKGDYSVKVVSMCEKILGRLAQAEAHVHGVPVEKVHFHEIGAIDTIIDSAGISLCIDFLNIESIRFSTLTDGGGSVSTRHGVMPVPVPAVVKLSEGFALRALNIESELLTPTGCAVLTAIGSQDTTGINGRIVKSGYACGDKVFENHPNLLRVFLLESAGTADSQTDLVLLMESDMDHVSGEIMGDVAGRLLRAGALDVCWLPVFMKKGRPGYRLSVLCAIDKKDMLAELIVRHTRTLGVRMLLVERSVAQRAPGTFQLRETSIEEKRCSYNDLSFTKPEYGSLAALSDKTGIPIIELMEEYVRKRGGGNPRG